MPNESQASRILDSAERYVIQKSPDGVTVGLYLDPASYGEGHSPEGDLEAAVKLAYERARPRTTQGAKPDVPSA